MTADSLLGRNAAGLDRIISRMDSAAVSMPQTAARMDTLTSILLELSRKLNSENSTAGALLSEREVLDKLESTIDSLEKLIRDIEENPKKYFKLSIF